MCNSEACSYVCSGGLTGVQGNARKRCGHTCGVGERGTCDAGGGASSSRGAQYTGGIATDHRSTICNQNPGPRPL